MVQYYLTIPLTDDFSRDRIRDIVGRYHAYSYKGLNDLPTGRLSAVEDRLIQKYSPGAIEPRPEFVWVPVVVYQGIGSKALGATGINMHLHGLLRMFHQEGHKGVTENNILVHEISTSRDWF